MPETHQHHLEGDAGGLYAVLIIVVILILAAVLWFSGALGGGAEGEAGVKTGAGVEAAAPGGGDGRAGR